MTVLGTGFLSGLLLLTSLAVAYFLPLPVLVVPAAAAAAAVVYVTRRSRRAEGGPAAAPSPPGPDARDTATVPAPRRPVSAWPTGRRRRPVPGSLPLGTPPA